MTTYTWQIKTTCNFLLLKEIPEPFPLPDEISIVKAAAGWAHCVAVTGTLSNVNVSGAINLWETWSLCILWLGFLDVEVHLLQLPLWSPPSLDLGTCYSAEKIQDWLSYVSRIAWGMGCLSPLEVDFRIKLGLKCISYHDISVKACFLCRDVRPLSYDMLSILCLAGVAGC